MQTYMCMCISISLLIQSNLLVINIGFSDPPRPLSVNLTTINRGSINDTFLISWSQSNCAVQYVVTIIDSSDDRVYPNITTSNTSTTVTLPTGVEFCVTLVAVDSIGRRGPDTTPVCYCKLSSPYLHTQCCVT